MILLDTNILVFACNIKSPHQQIASQLIEEALNLKIKACVAHQNVLEFFSVITNPKRVENPLSLKEAFSIIKNYISCNEITKIFPSSNTLSQSLSTAQKLSLAKTEIFDCYLAHTMLEYNVLTIYTDNISDFRHYPQIKAINPF